METKDIIIVGGNVTLHPVFASCRSMILSWSPHLDVKGFIIKILGV